MTEASPPGHARGRSRSVVQLFWGRQSECVQRGKSETSEDDVETSALVSDG